MKRLRVLHISGHKGLIARSETGHMIPKAGSVVVTKKMKKIGKVYDVFGPVKCPYISIRLRDNVAMSDALGLKNQRVYVCEVVRNGRGKKD